MKRNVALKVAGIYLLVAGAWIFFSDKLLELLVSNTVIFTYLSITKGFLFVIVTAAMLYWLIGRDVSKITQSRDFYLKILDDFPALIWRSDTDAKCDFFNRTWLAFTGRKMEEEIGDGWANGVHSDDLERCLGIFLGAFLKREPFEMEYRLRRHDGEYRWVVDYGRPFYTPDSVFAGYIGSCYDITDRRSAENEIVLLNRNLADHAADLETAVNGLRQVNDELEAFNYTVSHDLRAPLTNISMCAQVMMETCGESLRPECHGHMDEIRRQVERMDCLIKSLLDLSYASRKELNREKIDLSAMAEEIAASLQVDGQGRNVTFSIMPGAVAEGDANLIRVVLENLMGNAWKYTGKKEEAAIAFGFGQGERTEFFVRDNGAGFDMKDSARLFETFQRLHPEGDFDGFGIGLGTVRRIIHRHGGRIRAEGSVGEGATFYFTLPDEKENVASAGAGLWQPPGLQGILSVGSDSKPAGEE